MKRARDSGAGDSGAGDSGDTVLTRSVAAVNTVLRAAETAIAHERAELHASRAAFLQTQADATQKWGRGEATPEDKRSTSAACSCTCAGRR